jgi:predicted TIM-barrel fold metal-dependent hydrolase
VPAVVPSTAESRTGTAVEVRQVTVKAARVVSLALTAVDGRDLPLWAPGAHVDLVLPSGQIRQYSLCGDLDDRRSYPSQSSSTRTPEAAHARFMRQAWPALRDARKKEIFMYNGTPVLDVHAHVTVPLGAFGALPLLLGSNTSRAQPILRAGKGLPPRFGITDDDFRQAAAGHVDYIDQRRIERQVIGPRPFVMLGWMEDHLLESWCREVNEMIHQQCTYYPDRFLGACQLPQISHAPDTRHVLPELHRCIEEYGFVAAYVSPDPAGRGGTPGMDKAYWYPLYEACESMAIPLIVHGTNSLDKRLRTIPNNYQIGFVVEQYIATQLLSHSDVFDRFSRLKVVICHCGGALDRFVKGDPHLASRDTSDNLFFDTNAPEINYLTAAIRQRGVDQMCFGVEAPGSSGFPRPGTGQPGDDLVPVIAGFEWLTEEDKLKILHHNPARVVPALAQA